MIVVNFKTYKEATGYRAVRLAQICRRVMAETKVRIVAVPQVADLRNCVETGAECWVQHVDPVEQGKNTGGITVEEVEEAGAAGTLLNHSEHKLAKDQLEKTMKLIAGMAFQACICVADLEEAKWAAGLEPDYIAYEPPELVGSIVLSTKCSVLIGAGVHTPEDVKVGIELGVTGILVATDIVLAEDPEYQLRELARVFSK